MSHRNPPYGIPLGGTGSSTVAGAQTNLQVAPKSNTLLLDGSNTMTADLNFGGFNADNAADPTTAQQLATKNYVDTRISGATGAPPISVRLATTGSNIGLSGSAPNIVDGVTLNLDDIILVKDQTTQSQNGPYQVTTVGTGSNGTWARPSDFNASADFSPGMLTAVGEGTTNQGSVWMLTTDETITLGTSTLVYTQVNGAFDVSPGSGLQKSGNVLSVEAADSTITVSGSGIKVSATYPGNTSFSTAGTFTTGVWNATKIDIPYGGTNATTAGGARSSLSAAPNTPVFWLGTSNGECANAVVPSNGTGIIVTAATGVIAVDTTTVATGSNTLSMSGKTLISAIVEEPYTKKTGSYNAVDTDTAIMYQITSASNAGLPASSGMANGQLIKFLNSDRSTANLSIITQGGDTGANGVITTSPTTNPIGVAYPGDELWFKWDTNNSEYVPC